MSVPALVTEEEDDGGSCLWDFLSDDVVAHEILPKLQADDAPFHPRFVLQCARKGVFVWSSERLFKLLSLKPVGPFIQEVQEALRFKFLGSEQLARFESAADASHPLFACKNLERLHANFTSPDALSGLPKLSATLRYLDLGAFYRDEDEPLSASKITGSLASLSRLTSLGLTANVKGLDLAFLIGLTALRSLFLSFGSTAFELPALRPPSALESLTLRFCTITSETLAPFDRSTQLTSIGFEYCALKDSPLSRLSTLTSLARLEMHGMEPPRTLPANLLKGLTRVHLGLVPAWISSCTALSEFKGNCYTADDLALLEPLARLTSLSLTGYRPRCTSLSPLSSLVGLQVLDLEGFDLMQDFSALSRMTALTRLYMRGPFGIDDGEPFNGFAPLASLPSLRHLEAIGIRCFDEGQFEHLARLTTLTHLSLSYSAVYDAALAHLRALAMNLRSVDLYSTSISDQGVRDTLVHLTKLRMLHVNGCEGVTIEGVRSLSSLRRLERLDVTEDACWEVEEIRAANGLFLPGVAVGASHLRPRS